MKRIVARWAGWDGGSLEHLVLTLGAGEIVADAVHVSGQDDGYAARYRIVCDAAWRTHLMEIEVTGADRRLLRADGRGNWTDGQGRVVSVLAGVIDPDLSITPFTNTLPIRRLGRPPPGGTAIETAWVSFPDLAIHRDPQRYTCLGPGRRWRYESRDSGFSRELEIDADGLVVSYPGLFRRIA
ncbi:putative glycolipid-binding domain-containing protein [Geminicoccus harenae]|uniref:putative glycolipid-binding domain-containing protein n=1 Tax=Geminicoccus harenae TaxID=2498453 RepID=UPI00168BEE98|nr:putative glycolipid-binding domain-containing protein [Geminicoccus harenae]